MTSTPKRRIRTNAEYTRTLIALSDAAADHLVASDEEYGYLLSLRGTKSLNKALPARTKGKVEELLVKAQADPHFLEVIHTGGAKYEDLIAIAAGEVRIQVKRASEAANGFALVGGLHPYTDVWHVIYIHRRGYGLSGRKYRPPVAAVIPPKIFTPTNMGYAEGKGYYVSIPMNPNSRGRHRYVRDYFTDVAGVDEIMARQFE